MEPLHSMLQHRSVDFLQHVEAHLDVIVGIDADDVTIERGVMQLAQCEAVRNARLAFRIAIRDMWATSSSSLWRSRQMAQCSR